MKRRDNKVKKKVKKNIKIFVILVSIILALLIIKIINIQEITGFAVLTTITQANFNAGTYNETFYNTTTLAVQLNLTDDRAILSGNYTSQVFDAVIATNWRNLSWTENITNRSGNVSFRVRSCFTSNCAEQRPFVGPDNTTITYFWQSNLSLLNNTLTPDSRYFQYMAFFAALDNDSNADGPILHNVSVDYGDCVEPINDMYINENTTLCFGTFYVNDTDGDSNVITISNDSVFVTCNKTNLVGNLSGNGFYLNSKSYVTISGCWMVNYTTAIRLITSNFTTITENNITNITVSGIRISDYSNSNIIDNNSIMFANGSSTAAIFLQSNSLNNTVKKNLIKHNGNKGLDINAGNTTIINNTIINNTYGISVGSVLNITIANNTIAYNDLDGINGAGNGGWNSSLIYDNFIIGNLGGGGGGCAGSFGINIILSYNNYFYNNILNNSGCDVYDNGQNFWNTSNYSGTNIIGGPMIGGNYYSDYGFYDYYSDGDGIGELSYRNGLINSYDALPLTNSRCLVPNNIPRIERSVVLCPGIYSVVDNSDNGAMNITNSSVIIECNQTRIIGTRNQERIINTNPGSGQLTNITVKNCYFEPRGAAIQMINTSSSYIYDNVINMSANVITTIYLYNVNNSLIANNTFANTSNEAIEMNDVSNSIFENNTIWKISGHGMEFESKLPSTNVTIRNNLINYTVSNGITSNVGTAIYINNSKFYNNTFANIGATGDGSVEACIVIAGFGNEFIGNKLLNCTGIGISSGLGVTGAIVNSGDSYFIKSNTVNGTANNNNPVFNIQGSNITIINNTIERRGTGTAIAMSLKDINNSYIVNNTIMNISYGIVISDGDVNPSGSLNSKNITITGNVFLNITNNAMILAGDNFTIYNNTLVSYTPSSITAPGIYGISLNNSKVYNNTIYRYAEGIAIFNSENTSITNNSLYENILFGINITSSKNMSITNNAINNNTQQGILILKSSNITVEKNIIFNNSKDGISVNFSNYTIIINNTIRNNVISGISIFGSNSTKILNNSIFNSKRDGIYIEDSEGISILENIILNNSQSGIYDPSSFNITISNNIISNNSDAGIFLLKTINSTISNNLVYNNSEAGIRLNSSNYSIIENNNLSYNGIISYVTEFYMSAAVYRNDALGAVYNFTATAGASGSEFFYILNLGESISVVTNNTNVSLLVNGTANVHLALVKINSSDIGWGHSNLTTFFDNSVASSCLGIAQYISNTVLPNSADETNCTYFQANIFTANGNNNYTYNGLTNATITQDSRTLTPSLSAVSTVNIANLILSESSDNNITNNTITLSSGYGVLLDTVNNSIFTNNTILRNIQPAVRALGDSSLINKIINSTNVTTSVASSILKVYWFLMVYAHDGNTAFENVNVSFYNKTGIYITSALTLSLGYTPELTLLEYQHDGNTRTYYTNYTTNATRPGTLDKASISYNFTSSSLVDLSMPADQSGGGGGGGGGGDNPPGGCTDECSSGQRTCSGLSAYKECGNYDDDVCLEFGSGRACSNDLKCYSGNCILECAPDWQCSSWSSCINEKQTRTCIDKNICNSQKPMEEIKCSELIKIKEAAPEYNVTCFEAKGLSEEEIIVYSDLLKITSCKDEREKLVNIDTRFRCNGIEISINDASLNIVYKEKPSFFLNMNQNDQHKKYCPWCFNNKKDYDETGIDCGGSCMPCNEKSRLEFPLKPAKPDYRLAIFIGSSMVAISIGYLFLFRRKRNRKIKKWN